MRIQRVHKSHQATYQLFLPFLPLKPLYVSGKTALLNAGARIRCRIVYPAVAYAIVGAYSGRYVKPVL